MAASAATPTCAPGLCPSYAVICSFLERYGSQLDLPELTFPQLERYLRETSSVPKLLVDLHVKLLRKIGKSVSADRWEKYLIKTCQEFNTTWAWEIEHKGYKTMSMESKTGILKYLCECQFDENVKFKAAINEEDADGMRLQPIGRDKDGQMYWYQLDQDNNVRMYVEEQDDLDGSSWKCIVRDRNDLAEVVALLKTQIDPELLKRDLEAKAKEAKADEEGKKKKSDNDSSDEEGKDPAKSKIDDVPPKMSPKKEREQEEDQVKTEESTLNGLPDCKPELESSACTPSGDTKTIKEEPIEVTTEATAEATPEVTSEAAPEIPPEISTEAAPETNPEATQEATPAMTELSEERLSEQQAKIPLKKRGMKFTEGFDKTTSSVIVPNQAIIQAKDGVRERAEQAHGVIRQVNGELLDKELDRPEQMDTEPVSLSCKQSENAPGARETKEEQSIKESCESTEKCTAADKTVSNTSDSDKNIASVMSEKDQAACEETTPEDMSLNTKDLSTGDGPVNKVEEMEVDQPDKCAPSKREQSNPPSGVKSSPVEKNAQSQVDQSDKTDSQSNQSGNVSKSNDVHLDEGSKPKNNKGTESQQNVDNSSKSMSNEDLSKPQSTSENQPDKRKVVPSSEDLHNPVTPKVSDQKQKDAPETEGTKAENENCTKNENVDTTDQIQERTLEKNTKEVLEKESTDAKSEQTPVEDLVASKTNKEPTEKTKESEKSQDLMEQNNGSAVDRKYLEKELTQEPSKTREETSKSKEKIGIDEKEDAKSPEKAAAEERVGDEVMETAEKPNVEQAEKIKGKDTDTNEKGEEGGKEGEK